MTPLNRLRHHVSGAIERGEKTAIVEQRATTFDVHEGHPSWHQQRAGHISAGITSGFTSREDAEAFAARLKAHHPDMPVFVVERRAKPGGSDHA